ncbi:hypothetical protein RBG61_09625 [Paludicola sp. MB14-C6]|uniref:hypothetical protein n=1 Tax=Paludihabitans sp. MB14-C6 TaxID=3070656 RepID=UPI0027DE8331|nr:hypothetical protein [Paludicola sp. MB14-C6]WMJ22247.1 hypothetical protein RBG61_09625 [Paludicola sp. MB14-C6]
MKELLNNKKFIIAVRVIGWSYIILILVNTIFFYGKFLYKGPRIFDILGVVAVYMADYKFDWKSTPKYKKVILTSIAILLLVIAEYCIITNTKLF